MLNRMFGLSFSHLILLSVIALVVIGPKQLPEVARVIGRFINDLKRTSGEITKSFAEIRDSNNQTVLQQQVHEPAPIVSHEPGPSSVGFDIAPEPPPRQTIHAGVHEPTALARFGEPAAIASLGEPAAIDERDQLSFDINAEKSSHEQ